MSTTKIEMTTLSQVMEKLRLKKQDNEFCMTPKGFGPGTGKFYEPSELKIIKTYRFEGESDPADSAILYVIEAKDGRMGYSLDAYGMYSNHDDANYDDFIRKIPMEERDEQLILANKQRLEFSTYDRNDHLYYSVPSISKKISMPADDLAIRILIVDDDEDDFFITSEYIKNIRSNNFEIEWCFKYSEALENISRKSFDLYLIDYHLGAKTGLDLIKEAVKNNWEQPFILLTGKGNQQIDIEAMQAGAVDYLIKSELDTEKLERCIRYSMERAKSLRALKANEKKFRNIFERSADAVFLASKELDFIDVNDATSRLLDYPKDDLIKMNLFSFITDSDDVKASLKSDLVQNREVDGKEIIIRSHSDVLKYCLLAVSEEQNAEGHYYQGIIHDITNIKKAEKATLRMEKRGVADRLVHVLAHEVRNPLNNINLSLEQLSPDLQDTDSQIYVDIISRNSKRIEHLITELLGSSRPAQIVQQLEPLKQIIDESVGAAKRQDYPKKIDLEVSFPEEEVMVMADAEKLKIALLNIIINAVEATDQSEGKLQIILEIIGKESRLTIRDNGCGISEENLSRLFEPYFTAKRNGMGLGLATTLNILQSHKADVEVQSKLNEGTAFIIIFKVGE